MDHWHRRLTEERKAARARAAFRSVAIRIESEYPDGSDEEGTAREHCYRGKAPLSATTIFEEMAETGKEPTILAEELNLIQKSDAGELEKIVDRILAENPQAVEDVTSGGKKEKKARGFLLGQVMQKTKGQANPKVVSEILAKKLG